ncbi:MAG: nuclear transport factor 2 family protein, partial [Burkholderiales bacterium]|nr:nuclear transport factor 2 family protein [Burkholderiales bacterium]
MRRAAVFATAEAAEEAFYDAMQRGDAIAMMALWADDEDVACVHPNGPRLIGTPGGDRQNARILCRSCASFPASSTPTTASCAASSR